MHAVLSEAGRMSERISDEEINAAASDEVYRDGPAVTYQPHNLLRRMIRQLRDDLQRERNNAAILREWKQDAKLFLTTLDVLTPHEEGTPWKDGLRKLLGEGEK